MTTKRKKNYVVCDIDGTVTSPWYGIQGNYVRPPSARKVKPEPLYSIAVPDYSNERRHKLFRQDLMDGIEVALAVGYELEFITNGVGGAVSTQERILEMTKEDPRVRITCFSTFESRLAHVMKLVTDPETKDVRYVGDSLQDLRVLLEIYKHLKKLPASSQPLFHSALLATDNSLFAELAYEMGKEISSFTLISREKEPISEILSLYRIKQDEPALETIKKALEETWKTST